MDIYNRIEKLLSEKGITGYKLSKDTGISTGLISQWKKRMQSPSREKLQIVADYFNVSVDYLLGNAETKKETPDESDVTFDDFTYALYNESKELSEEKKQQLLEMAKFFKQQQDKEKGSNDR